MSHSTTTSSAGSQRSPSPNPAQTAGRHRRRQRSDTGSDSEPDGPSRRKRVRVDPIKRIGKHIARTILINFCGTVLLTQGLETLHKESDGQNVSRDKDFPRFKRIIELIPNGRAKLLNDDDNSTYLNELASTLEAGASQGRSDDTNGLKGGIIDIIGNPSPTIARNSKAGRGFNHSVTGRLLCPHRLDWDDPETRAALKNETIKVGSTEYARFLYEGETINPANLFEGLFRSEVLIQSARHIFISPSDAKGDGGSRSTRAGNAALNGMTSVTIETIAYVATQVRFALSSDAAFGQKHGSFDVYAFYNSVVKLLSNSNPVLQTQVTELLDYWNLRLFPLGDHAASDANDTAAAILAQLN